jgi:hypothetical protein
VARRELGRRKGESHAKEEGEKAKKKIKKAPNFGT